MSITNGSLIAAVVRRIFHSCFDGRSSTSGQWLRRGWHDPTTTMAETGDDRFNSSVGNFFLAVL